MLPEFPGPYRFALTFQDAAQAANAGLLPGAEVQGFPDLQKQRQDAGGKTDGFAEMAGKFWVAQGLKYRE